MYCTSLSYLMFVCGLLVVCLVGSSLALEQVEHPPLIDIAPLIAPENYSPDEIFQVQSKIIQAATKWGFFHVINHSIDSNLVEKMNKEMKEFFSSPKEIKRLVKRTEFNSRGYADDELTKRLVDVKEIFDVGPIVDYENLSAKAKENKALDGINFWPSEDIFPTFRPIVEEYYVQCQLLSEILFKALISPYYEDILHQNQFTSENFNEHTSFLRLNYYPLIQEIATDISGENHETRLGISRHTDAGALTILLQDEVSSLEVYSGSKQDNNDGHWVPVHPIPNALTINIGDMIQVWSNKIYKAAEHRVQASQSKERYSIAFFFNPNYDSLVQPLLLPDAQPVYSPIRWGDFRAARFQGDYADVGEEIQIEHFFIQKE